MGVVEGWRFWYKMNIDGNALKKIKKLDQLSSAHSVMMNTSAALTPEPE